MPFVKHDVFLDSNIIKKICPDVPLKAVVIYLEIQKKLQ